jgi:hypothetical protein
MSKADGIRLKPSDPGVLNSFVPENAAEHRMVPIKPAGIGSPALQETPGQLVVSCRLSLQRGQRVATTGHDGPGPAFRDQATQSYEKYKSNSLSLHRQARFSRTLRTVP